MVWGCLLDLDKPWVSLKFTDPVCNLMWALFCNVQKCFKAAWLLDDTMLGVSWRQHYFLHVGGTNKMERRPSMCYIILHMFVPKRSL